MSYLLGQSNYNTSIAQLLSHKFFNKFITISNVTHGAYNQLVILRSTLNYYSIWLFAAKRIWRKWTFFFKINMTPHWSDFCTWLIRYWLFVSLPLCSHFNKKKNVERNQENTFWRKHNTHTRTHTIDLKSYRWIVKCLMWWHTKNTCQLRLLIYNIEEK